MMRIAACQYHFNADDTNHYPKKMEELAAEAKQQGADLLLLPEYFGILSGDQACKNDKDLFASMQPELVNLLALFRQLAQRYEIYIQPGTTLVTNDDDQYVNRAYLFSPSGKFGFQDKLQLTAYEKESALIDRGTSQTVFTTPFGKIGIAVCYDSEFPEIVRPLVHAGATLILVPSYTTTIAGYHRVQVSCRARAIENQCYVAMSSMHGAVTMGVDGAEETVGAAGIYAPAEMEFSEDGIIAQGALNQHELIFADLDMSKIEHLRKHGHVQNYADSTVYQTDLSGINYIDLV